ncbi:hypothetical protein [Actinomadura sp. 9N407]|uniref:hypothetical protein n=1 Tax=Actinomadura sp. 9N407 TaxID=3375154 RepID=UPI00379A547D
MNEGPLQKATDVPPIDLTKAPPAPSLFTPLAPEPASAPSRVRPTQAGPAWIVLPARVIAVVIVLPVRLAYDLLATLFRGLMRSPRWLGRALRAAYMAVLHPILRPIGAGIAWLWMNGVYGPLHWLAVTVLLGGLRLFGRGTGWFYTTFLAPVVAFLGAGLNLLLVRPLAALLHGAVWLFKGLGTGLAFLGKILLVIPAVALWHGTVWLFKAIGAALAFLGKILIVIPAVALWRYVLRPPLAGLAWLARKAGTGIAAVCAIFAGAIVWAWRMLGRLFAVLGRILFVIPAVALYRYLLRPIGQSAAWLWRTLVMAPSRAVKNAVLLPVGRGVRSSWRGTSAWMRRNVFGPIRQTGRDVRLQVRRAFRG